MVLIGIISGAYEIPDHLFTGYLTGIREIFRNTIINFRFAEFKDQKG